MSEVLSESEIYVYSKRFLRERGWALVGGEPPGGSDGLPRIEAKHPDKTTKGSKGSKKVDIIAYRGGYLLLLELKSTFDRGDVRKLDELVGQRRWRDSLLTACEERNAFDRAGVADPTLAERILSGDSLIKGIGLGRRHRVPSEYVQVVHHEPMNVTVEVGADCPLAASDFES